MVEVASEFETSVEPGISRTGPQTFYSHSELREAARSNLPNSGCADLRL